VNGISPPSPFGLRRTTSAQNDEGILSEGWWRGEELNLQREGCGYPLTNLSPIEILSTLDSRIKSNNCASYVSSLYKKVFVD
jgi:hypothetical protein